MKIKAKGKIIFETFIHDVYEIGVAPSDESHELEAHRIEKENLDQVKDAVGNTTRRWIMEDYPFAEGYYFTDKNGDQVGSCWVMFKGGDEKLYKIRKHDSFIFRLEVDPAYRGKGYAKQIMKMMFQIIAGKGLHDTCLVCATKNEVASGLYAGLGMNKTGKRVFVRLFGKNIPYHIL